MTKAQFPIRLASPVAIWSVNTPRDQPFTDIQGTPVALTDATGARIANYSYDPYGVTRSVGGSNTTIANNNPLRFTGGFRDTQGLYKLGYRYYDVNTGRFTQPDPTQQEENTYGYSDSDPVNYVDPSGANFLDDLGGAVTRIGEGVSKLGSSLLACHAAGLSAAEVAGPVAVIAAGAGPETAAGVEAAAYVYGCAGGIFVSNETGFSLTRT